MKTKHVLEVTFVRTIILLSVIVAVAILLQHMNAHPVAYGILLFLGLRNSYRVIVDIQHPLSEEFKTMKDLCNVSKGAAILLSIMVFFAGYIIIHEMLPNTVPAIRGISRTLDIVLFITIVGATLGIMIAGFRMVIIKQRLATRMY